MENAADKKMMGYVIEFGEGNKIASKESTLLSTLSYINRLDKRSQKIRGDVLTPTHINLCELDDRIRNEMNILDESDFGYEIYAFDRNEEEVQRVFIPENVFNSITRSAFPKRYAVSSQFCYCCPVLDLLQGVKDRMKYDDRCKDLASWYDVETLLNLGEIIISLDEAQEGFICQIKTNAEEMTESKCQEYINLLKSILSGYEVQEQDHV